MALRDVAFELATIYPHGANAIRRDRAAYFSYERASDEEQRALYRQAIDGAINFARESRDDDALAADLALLAEFELAAGDDMVVGGGVAVERRHAHGALGYPDRCGVTAEHDHVVVAGCRTRGDDVDRVRDLIASDVATTHERSPGASLLRRTGHEGRGRHCDEAVRNSTPPNRSFRLVDARLHSDRADRRFPDSRDTSSHTMRSWCRVIRSLWCVAWCRHAAST